MQLACLNYLDPSHMAISLLTRDHGATQIKLCAEAEWQDCSSIAAKESSLIWGSAS